MHTAQKSLWQKVFFFLLFCFFCLLSLAGSWCSSIPNTQQPIYHWGTRAQVQKQTLTPVQNPDRAKLPISKELGYDLLTKLGFTQKVNHGQNVALKSSATSDNASQAATAWQHIACKWVCKEEPEAEALTSVSRISLRLYHKRFILQQKPYDWLIVIAVCHKLLMSNLYMQVCVVLSLQTGIKVNWINLCLIYHFL